MPMYAEPGGARHLLLCNVILAIADERPSHPFAYHDRAQILPRRLANGDGAPVTIGVLLLANDRLALDEGQ